MVLQLYGYPTSTCTLRVAATLKEKGVPFEFHIVDLAKGEHKAPGFVAHQPFGQVPYIKLALFEQAASIETSNYDPFVSGLAWELKFKMWFGGQTDKARVQSLHDQLKAKLDAYEIILAKQKYLAGDEFTLADLFHLPYGNVLVAEDINIDEFSSRPNVSRWWKDINSRESWQALKNGVA